MNNDKDLHSNDGRAGASTRPNDDLARSNRRSRGCCCTLVRRVLSAGLLALAIVATSREAHALQGGEDPALLPILMHKRFGGAGWHHVSLLGTTSVAPKYVETDIGGYAAYQYYFTDLIGLELGGGYFKGKETSIAQKIRSLEGNVEGDALSDFYQLRWMANLDVVVVPLYGRMSFASEFDPSFDLFLVAGGGLAGLYGPPAPEDSDPSYKTPIAPVFNVGGGLRFYIMRLLALRAEMRGYFFPDPIAAGGTDDWVTSSLQFQFGVQFSFGGES